MIGTLNWGGERLDDGKFVEEVYLIYKEGGFSKMGIRLGRIRESGKWGFFLNIEVGGCRGEVARRRVSCFRRFLEGRTVRGTFTEVECEREVACEDWEFARLLREFCEAVGGDERVVHFVYDERYDESWPGKDCQGDLEEYFVANSKYWADYWDVYSGRED
jgi:hypothetical protein